MSKNVARGGEEESVQEGGARGRRKGSFQRAPMAQT